MFFLSTYGLTLSLPINNIKLFLKSQCIRLLDIHTHNIYGSITFHSMETGAIAGAFLHSKHHGKVPSHLEGWCSNKQVSNNYNIISTL